MEKKEQARLRKQRQRDRERDNSVGNVTQDVTQYPAILYALADVSKRAKLRRVCQELKDHNQLKNVYYGAYGPPMDVAAEYLEAF